MSKSKIIDRAVGRHVIIRKLKEENTIIGGLELTETQDQDKRYLTGEVVGKGELADGVEVGEIVKYDKVAANPSPEGSELLYILKIDNIAYVV